MFCANTGKNSELAQIESHNYAIQLLRQTVTQTQDVLQLQ